MKKKVEATNLWLLVTFIGIFTYIAGHRPKAVGAKVGGFAGTIKKMIDVMWTRLTIRAGVGYFGVYPGHVAVSDLAKARS